MSQLEQLQVFQSMNSSPHARLQRSAELGDGLVAALWSSRDDRRPTRRRPTTPCPAT